MMRVSGQSHLGEVTPRAELPVAAPNRPGNARSIARRRWRAGGLSQHPIDFAGINRAALAVLPLLLRKWLPGGRIKGNEYVALNPQRGDRRLGSFSINMQSGQWADFAINAKGGDPISLAAFLAGISQVEAASRLAMMLGVESYDR
jgi:hypothetical protein